MKKRVRPESTENALLLDVKQVAERLNIGVSTVWKMTKIDGFPQPYYFGPRVVRWKASDLEDWVKGLNQTKSPFY